MQPLIACAPLAPILEPGSRVLLTGAGGGYDVMGAVPLLVELEAQGCAVHLASLSFTRLDALGGVERVRPGLFAVSADSAVSDRYCPEAWLADWWSRRSGQRRVVYAMPKAGVAPLRAIYAHLAERLDLDAIVLVDGGVDSLLRGDETNLGTPEEDLCSMLAVRHAPVAHRLLMCVGFGAEQRDGIAHAQVLERVAGLTAAGGFLGVSALLGSMAAGRGYLDALERVFAGQSGVKRSHIHSEVRAAMGGAFGDAGPDRWRWPLLNMLWFFDLDPVVDTHLFIEHLAGTQTIGEVTLYVDGLRRSVGSRPRTVIPI